MGAFRSAASVRTQHGTSVERLQNRFSLAQRKYMRPKDLEVERVGLYKTRISSTPENVSKFYSLCSLAIRVNPFHISSFG